MTGVRIDITIDGGLSFDSFFLSLAGEVFLGLFFLAPLTELAG